MISGLEGEKVRWTETVKLLGERQTLLVGDCLVAAGMVSYAGPFTSQFRTELEVIFADNLDLLATLGYIDANLKNQHINFLNQSSQLSTAKIQCQILVF